MTLGIEPAHASSVTTPVTLLYVRADGESAELDERVHEIVRRYEPLVELRALRPAEVEALTGERPAVSRIMVMRAGQVVGQAMGSLLPARELDRVVRCAVEW